MGSAKYEVDKYGSRSIKTEMFSHQMNMTRMTKGGLRFECSCGAWGDFLETKGEDAAKAARLHLKEMRLARGEKNV